MLVKLFIMLTKALVFQWLHSILCCPRTFLFVWCYWSEILFLPSSHSACSHLSFRSKNALSILRLYTGIFGSDDYLYIHTLGSSNFWFYDWKDVLVWMSNNRPNIWCISAERNQLSFEFHWNNELEILMHRHFWYLLHKLHLVWPGQWD